MALAVAAALAADPTIIASAEPAVKLEPGTEAPAAGTDGSADGSFANVKFENGNGSSEQHQQLPASALAASASSASPSPSPTTAIASVAAAAAATAPLEVAAAVVAEQEDKFYLRIGGLTVHKLGHIEYRSVRALAL